MLDEQTNIVYQGRIDDQIGIGFQRPQATSHDLADALKAVLAGKNVSQPVTAVAGCFITRAPRPKGEATDHLHQTRVGHLAAQLPGMPSPGTDRADAAPDL